MTMRRSVAVLNVMLLAQLWLVGASPLCRQGETPPGTSRLSHPKGHVGHSAPDSSPRDNGVPDHDSVPRCAATSMCAVVMVVAATAPMNASSVLRPPRVQLAASTLTSVTRSPEIPPPRP